MIDRSFSESCISKETEFYDSKFTAPIAYLKNKTKIKTELSNDLELIHGENPLYKSLFNAEDDIRLLSLKHHSTWYTTDKTYLRDTQSILKGVIPTPPTHDLVITYRNTLIQPDAFIEKYNYLDWDKIQFLNKNSYILQCMSIYNIFSPIISLALPLLMLIIPFFLIRIQNHTISWTVYYEHLQLVLKNHSLGQLFYIGSASWDKRIMIIISIIFYFVQVYFNCASCVKFIRNMTTIHKNISIIKNYISETITSMKYITTIWNEFKTYKPFIENCNDMCSRAISINEELHSVTDYTLSIRKLGEIGKIMRINYMMHMDTKWKETIEYCVEYNSYIHSMRVLKDKIGNGLNYCKFGKTTKFKDLIYPHIASDHSISNDITLDKNILITGPNAAGKTTILKATMINIILCQQFGCGYFKSAKINPYDSLNSYINIPDTSGRDSLFQAEASRCKVILDEVTYHRNQRHLCIFDELFSGTNPYEAIGAATAYLKYINTFKNVSFILTTHFLELCRILDKTCNVNNLQMQVRNTSDGYVYSYKIIEGISSVKGGIKVLTDLNYPPDMIKDSIKIMRNLTI